MTREEAIQELQNCKDLIKQDGKDWFDERDLEVLDMAIDALSADAVSREEYEELYRKAKEVNEMANDILADFPSYEELVSVVRCKDCRWQEECSQFVVLHKFCGVYQEISFCSHGERREP